MKERRRSVSYPSCSWLECLEFIKKLDIPADKSISIVNAAKKIGVSSKGLIFKKKISTAKQFKLITVKNGFICLTNEANALLDANDNEKELLQRYCFLQAPLYAKIAAAYHNKKLPEKDSFADILVKKYSLTDNTKDDAAKYFFLSISELGFLKNGLLDCSTLDGTDTQLLVSTPYKEEKISSNTNIGAFVSETSEDNFSIQTFSTSNGNKVQIMVSSDATKSELEMAHAMLEIIMSTKA